LDHDGRAGWWPATVVLLVWRRANQSGSGAAAREKEKWRRVSSTAPRTNR
jgi:hypothetical protein